jgi:hypothetical protein
MFHPSTAARAPATKVQLYLVRGRDDLRRIQPALPPGIAGFYRAMNEGVFAVALTDGGLGKDDVLFHEYAHHFMLENFPAAYPAWFVEGFAEYFMTTDITWKGIKVGSFNQGRVNDVFIQTWVPLEDLLSKTVWEVPKNRREVFYAQSWLLMHYMRSDPVRGKQLDAAILATAEGEAPVEAFQTATGMDMAQLTAALRKYNKLSVLTFKEAMKAPPAMTVMRLRASADDLLLDNLHLILASTGAPEPKLLAACAGKRRSIRATGWPRRRWRGPSS